MKDIRIFFSLSIPIHFLGFSFMLLRISGQKMLGAMQKMYMAHVIASNSIDHFPHIKGIVSRYKA